MIISKIKLTQPKLPRLRTVRPLSRFVSFLLTERMATKTKSSNSTKEKQETRNSVSTTNKKGMQIEGYRIEGLSIAGHETCIIFPSLDLAFDIGRCPDRAISQDFLFISHAHMDHIVSSLIYYFLSFLLFLAALFSGIFSMVFLFAMLRS